MRCTWLAPNVVVCGTSGGRRCSTPGCARVGELACDHPVKRDTPPKVGDARLHRVHRVIFYIWLIEGDEVTVGKRRPGHRYAGRCQVVTLAELAERSDPTCDKPVCKRCAGRDGELDYCGAHARAREEQRQLPP